MSGVAQSPKGSAERPAPFSLRLTKAERDKLEALAGSRPLGAFIRAQLLGETAWPRQTRRKPKADHKALAQALSVLGRSRLASNLNQIAKLAHIGVLPVDMELRAELHKACLDIAAMRAALMGAMGSERP